MISKKPKTLQNKRYPDFIRNNSAIKKYKSFNKNFENVGIADYSESYVHRADITLTEYIKRLNDFLSEYPKVLASYGHSTGLLRREYSKLVKSITVSSIKKKNILVLPCSVKTVCGSNPYKKGSSLLTLLYSILISIEDLFEYGNYDDDDNLLVKCGLLIEDGTDLELSWNKNLEIVFSTHPWDIATMSMRGIASCQSWGKTQSKCLIGSIIDPNTAVIYITDGKKYEKYGTRMLARSVVRVINSNAFASKVKVLFLERTYTNLCPFAESKLFNDIFGKSLNRKCSILVSNKSTVLDSIPLTSRVKKLPRKYWSYRDSTLSYA